jgi:arylsulfatase A
MVRWKHGFDSFFGISASLDMPPFVYIENHRFTEVPMVEKKWVRSGPAAKDFEAVNVLPDLTRKAVEFVNTHADAAKQSGTSTKPFFLYLAFTAPHTPIVPTKEWQGKSGLGPYGDFVMETDSCAGEVLKAIDTAGLTDNTLVIFASDNGCSPAAKVEDLEAQGHFPSAGFRGYKSDIWDGGHRIPFIVRWPGHIKPGSQSDALVCLTDFTTTCADLLGATLPAETAEDSQSILPILLDKPGAKGRADAVHHSIDGMFAIRQGKWKLELCPGSGGWSAPREADAVKQGLPPDQLYDMDADPGEQHNLAAAHPEIVKELTTLLQKQIDQGRSTPGPVQKNDARIVVRKPPARAGAEAAKGD